MNENTRFSELAQEEKDKYINSLNENIKIFGLQAKLAKKRSRLQKFYFEELIYALRIDELRNPKKVENDQPSTENTDNKQSI